MSEENFNFEAPKGATGCGVCPLAVLPRESWEKLLRRPFRKRHPVFFWGGAVLLICIVLFALTNFFANEDENDPTERIALISITGPIMDVAPTLEWIQKVYNSPAAKGALVRVDSPGGGAAASQEIYASLARLAQKMPVAVSMGATAASGGLMVSMAGNYIFANPSTVTGSIGVRMDIPQLQGLMDKLGIGQETLVTAPFKNAASYLKPLTPEDRAYLDKVLLNMHDQFVEIVAKGRNLPLAKVRELANGKIYTGQQALALGLIDALGGQTDAHLWLAEKTGIPPARKLLKKTVSKARMLEKLLATGKIFGINLSELIDGSSRIMQPVFMY